MSGQTGVSLSGKWNVSFIELINDKRKFKVIRSFVVLHVNETKFFDNEPRAKEQFSELLLE